MSDPAPAPDPAPDPGGALAACARVLEAVSAATLVHAGGRILLANAAMQRLLGYSQAQLQAMEFDAWADPAARAALREHGLRCLHCEDELPVLEVEALTASGARRVLEVGTRGLQQGQQVLVLLTAQDLSDMRYVQQSLLEVGRVMHQIVENDPVPTFVIDAQHRVTHWNAACARLTGLAPHEMLGSTEAWRAFYAQRRPMLAELIVDGSLAEQGDRFYGHGLRRSQANVQAFEYEDFFPKVGGQGRWLFFSAAPLLDTEGSIIGAIETLQDVSARRTAEDELRHHRQELEEMVAQRTAELLITHHDLDAFMENAPVGIVATEGPRIVRSNKTFCRMFEVEEGQEVGLLNRSFFLSEEDYKDLVRVVMPRLQAGEPVMHETKMRTASGREIWVQLIVYVADPNDAKAKAWWLLQDRSEMRRAQQELVLNYRNIKETNARLEEAQNQLLQSEKMASIGQLAAGVAHEINNPIGFVSSNLGSLRRYVEALLALLQAYLQRDDGAAAAVPDEQLRQLKRAADIDYVAEDLPQLLKESEEGLSRVKKIVQDLKDFSRVDHADWQDADLNAGLESTLNVVMNEVKYKAEVRREYGRLPPVRCLAGQLNQVFMNLIVNAAHAIPERGVITLRSGTERQGETDWAWVEVQDDGCGMPPEVQKRIFEPFYTTKPVGKGTGLGLSLSFSIVQKHGGRIELQSAPGEGTRFRVWVPVAGPKLPA